MTSVLMNVAIEYARRGWKIFPVAHNHKYPHPELSKGGYKCATNDLSTIKAWWTADPQANIGLSLADSGLVCLDADTYKSDCSFDELEEQYGMPTTLRQRSASGGLHLIFKCLPADKFPGQVGTSIDIKHNGYILLSPSVFEGNKYVWDNNEKIASAPHWLKTKKPNTLAEDTTLVIDDSWAETFDIEVAIKHASLGEAWHNNVLRSVGAMVARGLQDHEIHAKTDLTTQPDYSVNDTRKEVQKMIDGARRKGFDTTPMHRMQENLDYLEPIKDRQGNLICNHLNITKILLEHHDWSGVFAFNKFTQTEQVIETIGSQNLGSKGLSSRPVEDGDYTRLSIWLNAHGMTNVQKHIVVDAVKHAAAQRTFNPVDDYLNECMAKYDLNETNQLLDTWMMDFLGVKRSTEDEAIYIKAVSRLSLIQAVARARNPGCKADSVVILEGQQGTGKSSAIRVLFGEAYFGDQLPPMSSKDASSYLKGKWCVELAELEYKRKAEVETIKAFITRTHENYRPAFGREEVNLARTTVFLGTTNATEYLVDETGNRRFLPVSTHEINLNRLAAARDQLWAAAAHAYNENEPYWLVDETALIAAKQASARLEQDPWVEIVLDKLGHLNEVSIKEAYELCFSPNDTEGLTQIKARRMSKVLTLANWSKDGKFHAGSRRNQVRFVNQNELKEQSEEFDF
jgi:predicted P-loop ATPase